MEFESMHCQFEQLFKSPFFESLTMCSHLDISLKHEVLVFQIYNVYLNTILFIITLKKR